MVQTKIITITSQKGGTGKTTTAVNLAYGLASRGQKVLLIDLDQQQSTTTLTVGNKFNQHKTSFELLTGKLKIKDVITPVNLSIDLIPAGKQLKVLDITLDRLKLLQDGLLKKALARVKSNYKYIIIDTPPALGMTNTNALVAANYLIILARADVLSVKGITDLAVNINQVKENENPQLKIAGILITQYRAQTVFSKELANTLAKVAKSMHTQAFKAKIRDAIAIPESESVGKSIFDYAPKSNVAKDMNNFISELVEVTK